MTRFGICKCFYQRNFYIKRWKLHVNYTSDKQFLEEHSQRQDVDHVLAEVKQEIDRRFKTKNQVIERQNAIEKAYVQPLHPHLYKFQESFLDPGFKSALRDPEEGETYFYDQKI